MLSLLPKTSPGHGAAAYLAANWLIAADQTSLVLTDFGACVDSLRPHSKPPSEHSSAPEPTRRGPSATAVPRDAVVGPGVQGKSPSTVASAACAGQKLQPADGHALTPTRVSPAGATGVVVETSGRAGTKRPRDAVEDTPAAPSSTAVVESLLEGSLLAASQPPELAGNVSSPLPIDGRGRVPASNQGGKRRRCSEGTDSGSTSAGIGGGGIDGGSCSGGGSSGSGGGGGGGTGRASEQSCGARATAAAAAGEGEAGDPSDSSREPPSKGLVFPFSDYFVAGTPSIVAPELARAWREKTELDFRRSDVRGLSSDVV